MKTIWIWGAILSTFLSGGAMAAAISVPTPSVPPPLIRPLPIKMGLCVSPALRAARLREVKNEVHLEADDTASGQAQTWLLGNAVVDTLTTAMRAAFEEVVVIDGCTPGAAPAQQIADLIVPTLVEAESPSMEWSKGTVGDHLYRHGHIVLQITLQSMRGTSAVSWNVSGAASIYSGLWHYNSQELVGRALSAALLDGGARFIADLKLNTEVNDWLVAESLPNELLDDDTAARNRSDIAILNNTGDVTSPQSMADCVSSSLSK